MVSNYIKDLWNFRHSAKKTPVILQSGAILPDSEWEKDLFNVMF